tara:strand:- start:5173 stop:8136 length:2964 start_codon:yes stop_codon:yes gene_type:complete
MSNTAEIRIVLGGSNSKTINKRADALTRLATSVNMLAVSAKSLPQMSGPVSQYSAALTKTTKATKKMTKATNAARVASGGFIGTFSRMIKIMSAFAVITLVTRALAGMVKMLVMAPAQMELWNAQLRTLSGSATIAAEKLELLKTVAIETPLELPDLFEGLTTLKAFNIEMSEETLPLIADLAAVSGRTFQDISEVVGKVIQGSATAITRSLPTIGINPSEFKALALELGNRSDALFSIIESRFAGFAKESAKTTIGLVSNIKDAIFVIASDIGGGLLSAFRPAVQEIFDFLNELRQNGPVMEEFKDRLFGIGQSIVEFGRGAMDAGSQVVALTGFISSLVAQLGGLKNILMGIASLKISGAIMTFLGGSSGGRSVVGRVLLSRSPLKALMVVLSSIRGRATLVIAVFAVLALAYNKLFGSSSDAAGGMDQWSDSINRAAEELGTLNGFMEANAGLFVNAAEARRQAERLGGIGYGALNLVEGFNPSILGGTHSLGTRESAIEPEKALEIFKARAISYVDQMRGLLQDESFASELELVNDAFIALGVSSNLKEAKAMTEIAARVVIELGGSFAEAAVKAQDFSDALEASVVPMKGFVGQLTSEEEIAAFVKMIQRSAQDLETTFGLELIDEDEYVTRLRAMRESITAHAMDLFGDDGPNAVVSKEAARSLLSIVGGMERVLEGIEKVSSDALERIREENEEKKQALVDGILQAFEDAKAAYARGVAQLADFGGEIELFKFKAIEGMLSEQEIATTLAALIAKVKDRINAAVGAGDAGVELELRVKLKGLEDFEADPIVENITGPLETALRQSLTDVSNAVSGMLAHLIKPKDGASLGQMFNQMIAGLLNAAGDALIQMGIASEVFATLIEGFGLPGLGYWAIAIGVGLKAFASAMGGNASSQIQAGRGGSQGSSISSGPIDFGTFGQPSPQSSVVVTINALDAGSVSSFVQKNAEAFGQAVVHVADRDRATGGNAFGVFGPQAGFVS